MTSVSLVATVLNEGGSIEPLLASIAAQQRRPDQVVIVDGGSTDATRSVVAHWQDRLPLDLIVLPEANIAEGRNAGIAAASSEVIAVTDGGVRLSRQWLARLVAPFESADPPDAVSGFFVPEPHSVFELAMGATVLPTADEIDPETFLPSSRSIAFTKDAWNRAGGYPEWLDYSEDLVFDLRLRKAGCRFQWAPDAVVNFRPRSSLEAFFVQYFHYARGDGKAGLWAGRHLIRYATYGATPWLLALAGRSRPAALLLALACAAYLYQPYTRLLPQLGKLDGGQRTRAVAFVPLIRLVGDVAKMAGYPVGLWWRWRRRAIPRGPSR